MKRRIPFVFLLGLVAMMAAPVGVAATLTVGPPSPPPPGGQYLTVQAAHDAAVTGDTIKILPGEIRENDINITTPGLTILGDCGDPSSVVINGTKSPTDEADILDIDAADTTVRCLTLLNGDNGIDAGTVASDCDALLDGTFVFPPKVNGLIVHMVRFVHNDDDALELVGDDFQITNNWILNPNDDGLDLLGNDGLVQGNVIRAADSSCAEIDGHDLVFDSNDIRMCEDSDGLNYCGHNVQVTNNTIRDLDGDAICGDGDDGLISLNQIRNADSEAIAVCGDGTMVSDNEILNAEGVDLDGNDVSFVRNLVDGGEDDGVDIDGNNALVQDNVLDARGSGYGHEVCGKSPLILNNVARDVGSDEGFDIDCTGGCLSSEVRGNHATGSVGDDEGYTICAVGRGMTVADNLAEFNADEGYNLDFNRGFILNNQAFDNGMEDEGGFHITGNRNTITGNRAERTGGPGFKVSGRLNVLLQNIGNNNYVEGLRLTETCCDGGNSRDNDVTQNQFLFNAAEGIQNAARRTDFSGNLVKFNHLDCTNDAPGTFTTAGDVCDDGTDFTVPSEVD